MLSYVPQRAPGRRALTVCIALALLALLAPASAFAARRPAAPQALSGTAGDGSVSLSWQRSHGRIRVAGYRVYRNGRRVANVKGTSYVAQGLENGATYSFYIRAYDHHRRSSRRSHKVRLKPFGPKSGRPGSGSPTSPAPGSRPPSTGPQTTWAQVGSAPLTDAQAAAAVVHRAEQRPDNAGENTYVPSNAELSAFYNAKSQYDQTPAEWNPGYAYVTGRPGLSNPSTDDLIQWAAHKWGIPEDLMRAQMAVESWWRMSTLGDRTTVPANQYSQYPPQARIPGTSDVYQSMGIAQVRWIPDGSQWPGTEPLRWKSTAFNLDFYGATLRYYYDGRCDWCTSGYGAGQAWNSVGAWFNPYPWNNSGAQSYIQKVKDELSNQPWKSAGF